MNDKIAILSELLEQCSEASKLIISNAIAMENGDIAEAQKDIREVTSLLSVMLRDVFVEVHEMIASNVTEEESYDFSTLDIAKLLMKVAYNASSLINCYCHDYSPSVQINIETKLIKCMNATKSLVNSILLN